MARKREQPITVQQEAGGKFHITLEHGFAEVLLELPARLRSVLNRPGFSGAVAERLFPMAYKDPARETEYRRLLGDDLRRRKIECVDAFERTLRGSKRRRGFVDVVITPEEFELWLGFVNDMRLVLGTELDIKDESWERNHDPGHPGARDMALLHYLSWLESELLGAHPAFP